MGGLQKLLTNPLYYLVGEIFSPRLTVGNDRCCFLCWEGGGSPLEEEVLGDYLSQFASKMTRLAICPLSQGHIK